MLPPQIVLTHPGYLRFSVFAFGHPEGLRLSCVTSDFLHLSLRRLLFISRSGAVVRAFAVLIKVARPIGFPDFTLITWFHTLLREVSCNFAL